MPNVTTYNAATNTCEKGQEPRQTLKLLEVLKSQSLMPNAITHNAAISACEKGQETR